MPVPDAMTIQDLQALKERGERFAMLTAYDHPTARILDDAGVPVLLVGDSVGDNVLGYRSTIDVTLDDMVHHTAAVTRGARRSLVVADLPFLSYQASPADGLRAAARLLQEGGAAAVKLEGGQPVVEVVARLTGAGVPVMGHLGLTPQHVHQLGGHRVQGRDAVQAERILADAVALERAGAFALVLECVPSTLGRRVTEALHIPTIGIGAGPGTDGQVLVLHDLLGVGDGPKPRFAKAYADLPALVTDAVGAFRAEVATGAYPGPEHEY